MTNKKQAYNTIKELVNRFGEHIDEYKRGSYSETQTRVDFIDPFFIALGWDMYTSRVFQKHTGKLFTNIR